LLNQTEIGKLELQKLTEKFTLLLLNRILCELEQFTNHIKIANKEQKTELLNFDN